MTMPPRLPLKAMRHMSRHNRVAAESARALSRLARKFARMDARRPTTSSQSWTRTYEDLVGTAVRLQTILRRASNEHECAILAWSWRISPSKAQFAREPWDRLEGLSIGFVWQLALFEAALFRSAKAWLSYSWVTTHGWHDVLCEHQAIERYYGNATWRLQRLCDEMVWHAVPVTAADRLLIRRAHLVRALGNRMFHLKYRRAVRKWERDRGEHLPERKLRKPRRFTRPGIQRPEHDWNPYRSC